MIAAMFADLIPLNVHTIANFSGVIIAVVAFSYLAYVIIFGGLTTSDRKKVGVIGILFIFSAVFWSGFEQAVLHLTCSRNVLLTERYLVGRFLPAGFSPSILYLSLPSLLFLVLCGFGSPNATWSLALL